MCLPNFMIFRNCLFKILNDKWTDGRENSIPPTNLGVGGGCIINNHKITHPASLHSIFFIIPKEEKKARNFFQIL